MELILNIQISLKYILKIGSLKIKCSKSGDKFLGGGCEYIFLDKSQSAKSHCEQNASFYESFDMLLLEQISKKCPRICLPYTSGNHSNPICKTGDEENCANKIYTQLEKCMHLTSSLKHGILNL